MWLEGVAVLKALVEAPEVEVVRGMEQQLADAHQRILEATTLQDLLDRRDQLAQSQAMYFI